VIETSGDIEVAEEGAMNPAYDPDIDFRLTRSADSVQPGVLIQLIEPNQE
jgi:hypothetical protein